MTRSAATTAACLEGLARRRIHVGHVSSIAPPVHSAWRLPGDRRVHLLLDERRHHKIAIEAKRRNVLVAEIIRDTIDRMPASEDIRRSAIAFVLPAAPKPVPDDPADLRRELAAGHDRRSL